jgi:glycosyltransferase involved in cell wall biosynthesis
MARADAVIANSEWTAAHIKAEYDFAPKRLVVIPRGVDLTRFDPDIVTQERVAKLRGEWKAVKEHIVLLLPGRLTRLKGQAIFIAALARLRDSMTGDFGLRAVLAGDAQGRDAYAAELQRSIVANGLQDAIVIAGHVSDMPAACLAADIVISASTQAESFGRVVAEASAMGRAVIATDHGGARETVLPDISGFLVPPGDAEALATALRKLIAMGAEGRAAMGLHGRAYIKRNFTVDRMQQDTLALYREMLGLS